MANNSGKRRGRVADMGIVPEQRVYIPPPLTSAKETDYPIELDVHDKLVVRLRTYRKRIVDFAVMQLTRDDGAWAHVARIDCCGGTVHRHLDTRDGKVLLDHDLICPIPVGEGAWDVVEDSYEKALDEMDENWKDNLRRWRDGR